MWEAYVIHTWYDGGFSVYFWRSNGLGKIQYLAMNGKRIDADEGTPPPEGVEWRFPQNMLKALVGAATEKLPADAGMSAHLKDALTVRDRLLTLVERDRG